MSEKDYSIGGLLKSIRKGLGLTQLEVCHGLCSDVAYGKIEKGKIEAKPYLVMLFFERMGLSVNKYGLIYSEQEFLELQKGCALLQMIKDQKLEGLEKELDDYRGLVLRSEKAQKKYRLQFCEYISLIGQENKNLNQEPHQGIGCSLRKAVATLQMTSPEFSLEVGVSEAVRYSGIERALIAYVAELLYRSGEKEKSISLLERLLCHMDKTVIDQEEMVRQYPLFVLSLIRKQKETKGIYDGELCSKALDLLRNMQRIRGVRELLQYEKKQDGTPDGMQDEAYRFAETRLGETVSLNQGAVWGYLIEEPVQGIPMKTLLRSLRDSKKVTGAFLCDDICEPEHYSRLERGISLPSQKTFQEIMKRYGREGYRYYPNVVSSDYQVHLLYREMARDMNRLRYKEAGEKLKTLIHSLDMDLINNKQTIIFNQIMINWGLRLMSPDEAVKQLKHCLHLSIPGHVSLEEWPLTSLEVKILNGIAVVEKDRGNWESSIDMLNKGLKSLECNGSYLGSSGAVILMIANNMIRYLGRMERYKEAEELACQYTELSYSMNQGYFFLSFLYLEAWNHIRILQRAGRKKEELQKDSLSSVKQVITLSQIYGIPIVQEAAEKLSQEIK